MFFSFSMNQRYCCFWQHAREKTKIFSSQPLLLAENGTKGMRTLFLAALVLLAACQPERNPAEIAIESHFSAAMRAQGYEFGSVKPLDTMRLSSYYHREALNLQVEAEAWRIRQLNPPSRPEPGTVYYKYLQRILRLRDAEDSLARSARPLAPHSVRYVHSYRITDTGGKRQDSHSFVTLDTAFRVLEVTW